jgi:hypothetical protein
MRGWRRVDADPVDPPADLKLYIVADARVLIFHGRARDHLDTGYPCRARRGSLGCLPGGLVWLACLVLSIENFLRWLLMSTAGLWIAAHIRGGQRGIGYVGAQGTVVFISSRIQGLGPPTTIFPGIDRFAGISGGLLILLVVSWMTAPSQIRLDD